LGAGLSGAWLGAAGADDAAGVADAAGAAAGAWLAGGWAALGPAPQAATRAITPAARRKSNRLAVI